MTTEQEQEANSKLARLEAKLTKAATLREGLIEQVKSVAAQSAAPRGPGPAASQSHDNQPASAGAGTCFTQ